MSSGVGYDLVTAGGDAIFDGIIDVSVLTGSSWSGVASFDVLKEETIIVNGLTLTAATGAQVSWQVIVDADSTTDVFRVTAIVPELDSIMLLSLGGFLTVRSRRWLRAI